ncbi:biosynthetic-type acetolactate synthase large subunit [Acetatifactor muris]|uniref:Acetolactate synthase n=1 Tax=Acetatifactor muris TaxID=879566 RepID=A0A2K4ZDF8_9FIRM|nr:biosynthetic-type acetolactate synthase large subunit [Acetatifactor muris]MCR2046907.1 biosynthetic-type acetolactate synthase large subunit [Acetatifactor muris]SOY28505.1 Acetolactate synthase large subunit [Acetatifactor muris]
MQLNGSEIVVECLKEQGVDTVFGYPGGSILNIYDALYKHSDEIRHILTSHEQGAAHAADGYARATGKVGVCMATSGPGATNLVTGIATAYMDSVPMVAITANVTLPMLGKDSFQEVDIAGVTMPITKHGYIVKNVQDLADTLRRAFAIARSGRPGPVLVDITKDVTAAVCEYTPVLPEKQERVCLCSREELKLAADYIMAAKKPYIYLGGGAIISDACEEVAAFAELIDAPVCDTLMGKGGFDGRSPRYTGMIGMHGTKTSNLGVSQCDLLIALGARFSDRVIGNPGKFAEGAKIIHIDVDAAEINKNIRVDASLVGDLKVVLQKLNGYLTPQEHGEWMQTIAQLKEKYPLRYDQDRLSCPYIIETVDRVTEGEALITTDVGQHQMWAAQYYHYTKPRTFLSSGGLGTMGYGLGACIGAQLGQPDKICINIAGDGCFRMNMNELATASRYHIPIIQIVINNHVLGMVRQWQTLFYGKRYSQTVLSDKVDFCKVAEGLGCAAIRVTEKEEIGPALEKAIALKAPVLIECVIPEDDKVFPMVPAGASITEVFDGEDLR